MRNSIYSILALLLSLWGASASGESHTNASIKQMSQAYGFLVGQTESLAGRSGAFRLQPSDSWNASRIENA